MGIKGSSPQSISFLLNDMIWAERITLVEVSRHKSGAAGILLDLFDRPKKDRGVFHFIMLKQTGGCRGMQFDCITPVDICQ
jgi:hypothetical protein